MDRRSPRKKFFDALALPAGVVAVVLVGLVGVAVWQEIQPKQYTFPINNLEPAARRSSSPQSAASGTILARDSGSGTDVVYLNVPEGCYTQRLDYVGERVNTARAASVKFVVMQDQEEVRTTGPKDIDREGETRGVGVWSLDDDKGYTLTVYGINTAWNFLVRCD